MTEFLNMGGYAFYVWASYGLSVIGLFFIYLRAKHYDKKQHEDIRTWIERSKS